VVELSLLATAALYQTIRSAGIENGNGLRLVEKGGIFSLKLDTPGSNDRVIVYKSVPVLIIDRSLEMKLGNILLNVNYKSGIPDLVVSTEYNRPGISSK